VKIRLTVYIDTDAQPMLTLMQADAYLDYQHGGVLRDGTPHPVEAVRAVVKDILVAELADHPDTDDWTVSVPNAVAVQ
jgi:hypothetical protein